VASASPDEGPVTSTSTTSNGLRNRDARTEKIMPSFYQLILSMVGQASGLRSSRVTHAGPSRAKRIRPRGRGWRGQSPPIFMGNNHLRRDIGLPPLDRCGRPL
jgi:hypothetical protein